jgi:hypothetical protein
MNDALQIGTWVLTAIGLLYGFLGLVDLVRPMSKNRP